MFYEKSSIISFYNLIDCEGFCLVSLKVDSLQIFFGEKS